MMKTKTEIWSDFSLRDFRSDFGLKSLNNKMLKVNILFSSSYTDLKIDVKGLKFVSIPHQIPSKKWLFHLTRTMTRDQAIDIYNHYVIWLDVLRTGQPQIILESDLVYHQPMNIIYELLLSAANLTSKDRIGMVLYGKYSDLCHLATNKAVIPVGTQQFSLYKTQNAYGGYAYYVTPYGAQKLMQQLIEDPTVLSESIHNVSKKIDVYAFSPSIISIDDGILRYECRSLSQPNTTSSWWSNILWHILILLTLIVIGLVILFYLISNIRYIPSKEILSNVVQSYHPLL